MLTKLFLVGDYLYRYDYYVNVLCENKEKVELKCNGTCHLAKELKAADEKPGSPEIPPQVKVELAFFYQEIENPDFSLSTVRPVFSGYYVNNYLSPYTGLTSPPPKV